MNPAILGLAVVESLEVTNPVVAALLIAMQAPLILWTTANVQANPLMNIPLIAAGPAVVGQGGFTVGSPDALTGIVSAALGMVDPAGMSKMGIITKHYAATITQFGQIDATGLVAFAGPAPPPIGPVAGTAKMKLAKPFTFWKALALTDAGSIEKWTKYGDALKTHLETFALITPAMTNAIGAPLTGTGTVS